MSAFDETSTRRARLAIVDDHPLFCRGLSLLIASEPDLEVVATFGSAVEGLGFSEKESPDLVIVEVCLPGMSGMQLASRLAMRQPACKVLALSVAEEPEIVAAMLNASASGYACKADSSAENLRGIRAVLAGHRYISPRVSRVLVDAAIASSGDDPPVA